MYAEQIHNALDREDLQTAWQLMFERSAWIKGSKFAPRELEKLVEETVEIQSRLETIQTDIKERLVGTMERWHALRAYRSWRS